ncbi:MAG: hypothetical protein U0793_31835 [Gemmataceae bacterium]
MELRLAVKLVELLAGRDIPEPHRPVHAAGDDAGAIRREGERGDRLPLAQPRRAEAEDGFRGQRIAVPIEAHGRLGLAHRNDGQQQEKRTEEHRTTRAMAGSLHSLREPYSTQSDFPALLSLKGRVNGASGS